MDMFVEKLLYDTSRISKMRLMKTVNPLFVLPNSLTQVR